MSDENSKASPAAPGAFTFNVTPKELIVLAVLLGGTTLGGGTMSVLARDDGSAAIVTQVQELRQSVGVLAAATSKMGDQVAALQKEVNAVQTQLSILTSDGNKTEQQLKDHEDRIRRLEGHR